MTPDRLAQLRDLAETDEDRAAVERLANRPPLRLVPADAPAIPPVRRAMGPRPPPVDPAKLAAAHEEQRAAAQADANAAYLPGLRRMGVPQRTIDLLDGLQDCAALQHAKAWHTSGATFLLLLGVPGTGKTTAAGWVLSQLWASYGDPPIRHFLASNGRMVVADDLARLSYFGPEAAKTRLRLERVPVLVVDELGAEQRTDGWVATLNALVNERYGSKRRTVLVSNLSTQEFGERYGRRVLDRIAEDGRGVVLTPADRMRKGGGA